MQHLVQHGAEAGGDLVALSAELGLRRDAKPRLHSAVIWTHAMMVTPSSSMTEDHGGARSEAQRNGSGRAEAHLRERQGGGHGRSFWREASMAWDGGG